jgi:hypothetical protein
MPPRSGDRAGIALETQTRNLEFLFAFARLEPLSTTHGSASSVNFDGMAALVFQMRNMTAQAVVSVDGYEAKAGNVATQAFPFFDPVRMRVRISSSCRASASRRRG